jgi:hypothetical protein
MGIGSRSYDKKSNVSSSCSDCDPKPMPTMRTDPEGDSLRVSARRSIFKRGVMGTFHKISSKYLPLYVAEFELRYNNRENDDVFGTAINQC